MSKHFGCKIFGRNNGRKPFRSHTTCSRYSHLRTKRLTVISLYPPCDVHGPPHESATSVLTCMLAKCIHLQGKGASFVASALDLRLTVDTTEFTIRKEKSGTRLRGTRFCDFTPLQRIKSSGNVGKISSQNLVLWGVPSFAMFCLVFSQKFRLPVGLHSSCSISPMSSGTCKKYLTKRLK